MSSLALLSLVSVGGLGAAYVVGRALYDIASPSFGPPIDPAADGTALLVVDVQDAFTRPLGKHAFDPGATKAAIERINDLAHLARRKGWPVVTSRMNMKEPRLRAAMRFAGAPMPLPDTPDLELDARLELGGAEDFDKQLGDGFSNPELDNHLRDHGVKRILLTGLDGIACVQRTARGAMNRGYEVVIVTDAVLTAHPEDWATWQERLRELGATAGSVAELSADGAPS